MKLRARANRAASVTYKLCSLFLQYPDGQLMASRHELIAATADLPDCAAASALRRFGEWWGAAEALELEQHYVATFDLDKRCSLFVTYYDEGDRRRRGVALLRLKRLYRAAGLPLEGSELPDFLPVMLEFAGAAPDRRGEIVLREHRAALELLRQSLHHRHTPYAHVLDAACLTIGALPPADRARAIKLAAAGPPAELVGLEPFAPPELMPRTGARR
jgi:nitrate reductase delta subunit